uniref:Extended synaptotagmin 2 n=1 Tax=Sinocyclocheilus grahami TaxID=75366 RepID=A0A672PLQ0_SINGR
EWLNKTVKQMWPYVCQFVEKLFKETIEPAIKETNAHLSTFGFIKIDLGDQVCMLTAYEHSMLTKGILLENIFVGNTEIDVDVKRYYCRAGIKSIQLHGVLRVILEPLLGSMPLVGALSVFFLKKPLLDINWTGLTNILDIPGGFSDHMIQDIISTYMVLPNRITVPLIDEVELAQLRFPMPKGVLRIHFLEAQNLEVKDTYLGGLIKGKSDPYGMLLVSNQLFRSKTIKECLHPKWNEVYEALVYEHSGQHLEIELFDEDPDKDDFLGSLIIDLSELHKEQKVDEWFDLEEVATGKLHLRLEWLSLYPSAEKLDQVLRSIRANDNLSSTLLVVYLDSASNLPSGKKVSIDPNPFVKLTVGQKMYTSKVRYKTSEPLWEEAFPFLINNPHTQELEIEVWEHPKSMNIKPQHTYTTLKKTGDWRGFSIQTSPPLPKIAMNLHKLECFGRNIINLLFLCYSGSGLSQYPLGEVQLTIRHSSQRNKLIVVVHACRNLIALTKDGLDPFIRLYLLPDKSRSGRRKTSTLKKTLNPIYDQSFEFSVSIVELHRRTLDVAVKNGGGLLSKHKVLLGKAVVDLASEDVSKGWTRWCDSHSFVQSLF